MTTDRNIQIYQLVETNYRIEADAFYCSITGKQIGSLNTYEWRGLIESLSGTIEEAADDLAMRSLASMRPSMRWNRMRMETLDEMRSSAPIETMAYLLNRLFESKDIAKVMSQQLDRIHLYAHMEEGFAKHNCAEASPDHHMNPVPAEASPTSLSNGNVIHGKLDAAEHHEAFHELMLMLLEVEAKLGLREESAPIGISVRALLLQPAESLFTWLLGRLKQWHVDRMAYHAKCERDAIFHLANPGARRAYARQWFESAPKSEATIAREAKQSQANFFDSLFDELTNPTSTMHKPAAQRLNPDDIESMVKPAPFVRAVTKMPKWGNANG